MLTLKVQSTIEELHSLTESLVHIAREKNFSASAINSLQLVLEELLTNIRLYAYPDHPGSVELDVFTEEPPGKNRFRLCIRDWGLAFDPIREYHFHDHEKGLEERKIGGLGIHFVHSLSESMEYKRLESEKGGMNSLTLTLSFPDKTPGD